MKKIIFLMFFFLNIGLGFAGWEDIINQQEEQAQMDKVKILNERFKLEKFKTNQDFETFLLNKLYPKVVDFCKNYNQHPPYILYRANLKTESFAATKGIDNVSTNISYGKTNLQKANVDEPEILKLTKNYIAYYNKLQNKVYIISSPVDNAKLDLSKVKVTDTINVPSIIRPYSVRLFFKNDQLIVMGTRYSKFFNGEVTDVVFYKVNDGKAKFSRLYDAKGSFKDARITNNRLYLVTSYNFSSFVRNICDDIDLPKHDLIRKVKGYLNQKSIDVIYDKKSKLKIGVKTYPLDIKVVSSSLNNILFLPTNFDKLNLYDFRFNVVNIVDLDTKIRPNQYIIFGNMQNGIIHMTTKSLYLVNNYYEATSWRCRPGLICILPYFPRGNFILIHKLKLVGSGLTYVDSQIVPGRPINQYSMDEDNKGNFRIFTKFYFPKRATDLFVFDSNLRLVGKLLNIAPNEEFKSSRFIQDKAYLVTFKATDPLFVIDLSNLSTPRIIGELKIPGYSLYLHPLLSSGSVQYLLGIGQEAKEIHGNWSLPKNIKIDVYKIDFDSYVDTGDTKWKEVNYEMEKVFGYNGKNKTYYFSGSKLIVYLNKNCCNTEIKVFSDGNGNYKIKTIHTGMICRCFTPVKLVINTNNVKKVIFEESKLKNDRLIKVEKLFSYLLGKETKYKNGGSYTPVFDNPRTFVMYKSGSNYIVLLPVYLTKDEITKRCYQTYVWKDGKKQVQEEKCYDYVEKIPYFVGVKGLKINLEKGFKEVVSKNYLDLYKKAGLYLTQRSYKSENHRVSYYRQGDNTAILEINTNFANLFDKGSNKYLFFGNRF